MYIACPKCDWHPQGHELWACTCGQRWHTFSTHGVCPKCGKVWNLTACHACKCWSDHEDWYHDDEPTVDEYLANPYRIRIIESEPVNSP